MRRGTLSRVGESALWRGRFWPGWMGLAALSALGLLGCGEPETPEARVRALMAQAEVAAEAMDAAAMKPLVSETYLDDRGQDKQAVVAMLTFYFMRHDSVYLLTRIDSIAIPGDGSAEATVFVAMAGTPILAVEQLAGMRADLYRFDFALLDEDGQWRVSGATWRRAGPQDFLAAGIAVLD